MNAVTMNITRPWITWRWICEAHEFHDYESVKLINSMNSRQKIRFLWVWSWETLQKVIQLIWLLWILFFVIFLQKIVGKNWFLIKIGNFLKRSTVALKVPPLCLAQILSQRERWIFIIAQTQKYVIQENSHRVHMNMK